MMYCNALGFIPAFANVVQNVWRKVCGVITFGNATFCVLLYFLTSPRNILSYDGFFSFAVVWQVFLLFILLNHFML